jgi:hypothetical protein
MFAISPLMSALSTPTHRDGSQKQKGKRVELTQMTKSQGKAETESFEMRKAWSPRTWAMTRRNQAKHN